MLRRCLLGCEGARRAGEVSIVLTGGNAMTDSGVASDGDPSGARMLRWAATWRRWFEALNAFLERAFRTADVDTGC